MSGNRTSAPSTADCSTSDKAVVAPGLVLNRLADSSKLSSNIFAASTIMDTAGHCGSRQRSVFIALQVGTKGGGAVSRRSSLEADLVALHHRVLVELGVVVVGIVEAVVGAAALLAGQGGAGDQQCGLVEIVGFAVAPAGQGWQAV